MLSVERPTPGFGAESHRRILLVEDNERMLASLKRVLAAAGYELHAVSSAEAAFHELREHTFYAVIADYELGKHTGDEVLRAAAGLRSPPFRVLISGRAPPTRELREGGAFDAYFVKPFAMGALIELLDRPHNRS